MRYHTTNLLDVFHSRLPDCTGLQIYRSIGSEAAGTHKARLPRSLRRDSAVVSRKGSLYPSADWLAGSTEIAKTARVSQRHPLGLARSSAFISCREPASIRASLRRESASLHASVYIRGSIPGANQMSKRKKQNHKSQCKNAPAMSLLTCHISPVPHPSTLLPLYPFTLLPNALRPPTSSAAGNARESVSERALPVRGVGDCRVASLLAMTDAARDMPCRSHVPLHSSTDPPNAPRPPGLEIRVRAPLPALGSQL